MRKICILILFICIPINFYAFKLIFKGKYIPIDSLSRNDSARFVCLDIKTKKISFDIESQSHTFTQENSLDSTKQFPGQSLICKLEKEYIVLNIGELKRIERDSIYISATYQAFNEKGNTGKPRNIKMLAISKSELLGVVVSPSIKEIKRARKKFYWVAGSFAVALSAFSLIFGH